MNEPLLRDQQQNLDPAQPMTDTNEPSRKTTLLVYFKAFLATYSPKFLVLFVFILSVCLKNIFGLFLLIILLLSMILDVKTHWKKSWVAVVVAVVLILGCQIAFFFPSVHDSLDPSLPDWIGVGDTTGEKIAVFGWGFGLLITAILVALSQRWNRHVISQEKFDDLEERYKLFRQRVDRAQSDSSPENQMPDRNSSAYKEYLKIKPHYNAKKAIVFFRSIYHRHGYEWSLFCMLLAAFARLNWISVLYVIIATALSFCSHFFNSREEHWVKRLRRLRQIWRFFYILLSFDVVRQYFFFLWFPQSWNISKPFSSYTFDCDPEAKNIYKKPGAEVNDYDICINNYRSWLSLDQFSVTGLAANYISLFFMISYDNYFYPLKEESERSYRSGDENDFTVNTRTGFADTLKFIIFCYSYKMFLGIFVISGIMGNVTGKKADIISVVYVLIGLILLYKGTAVMKSKNQIWKFLEIFNCAVLIAFLVYEAPFFNCPIEVEGWEYYTNDECLYYQDHPEQIPSGHKLLKDTTLSKLILLIGLNKTTWTFVIGSSKMRSLIFFFLFGIVQRKIWNHVYMKAYVEPYLKKDILLRERRGIHYVEKTHVKRIGLFRNLLLKRSLLQVAEEEIDRKVKLWEQITTGGSIAEVREAPNDEALRAEDPRHIKCLKKISRSLLDKGIIMYKDLLLFMEECNYDPKETLKRVEVETKAIKHQLKLDLHSIPEIGLPPVRLESLTSEAYRETKRREEESKSRSPGRKEQLSPRGVSLELQHTRRGQGNETMSPLVRVENASPTIEPKQSEIIEQEQQQDQQEKKLSEWEKFQLKIKIYFLNKIKESFSLEEDAKALGTYTSFVYLGFYYLLTIWSGITYFMILLCFILSPSLITFFPALGVFCYAAVEYPVPGREYWVITMWYLIIALLAKFIIQLPFFCGGISLGITLYFGNHECTNTANYGTLKVDQFIGLLKFEHGILNGVIMDFLTLISLMICRFTLQKRGIWHHVALTRDRVYVPQFKDPTVANADDASSPAAVTARKGCFARTKSMIENFIWNLFPYNTSDQEVTQYNSVKKPGKDYYNSSVMIGIAILIYLLVNYTSMEGGGLSITQAFQQSSFSGGMVIAVTITIILILADRVLYVTKEDFLSENLRKEHKTFWSLFKLSSGKKVIFHYSVTIFIMAYTMVKLVLALGTPSVTYISIFFALCSLYLYNSACQVKYGYPLLSKTHTYDSPDWFSGLLYKIFKSIPFLSELRSILDWSVTKTALDLYQWMKVEDAWTYLYYKEIDNDAKRERKFGEARGWWEKCSTGWLLVVAILLLIIGPLVLFSSLNPSTVLNNIYTGSISLSLMAGKSSSAIYPIFSINNLLITKISNETYENTTLKYFSYLGKGDQSKVQKIQISNFPDTSWEISPPSLSKLKKDLGDKKGISFFANFEFQFQRPQPLGKETVYGSNAIYLQDHQRDQLIEILNETSTNGSVLLNDLFPHYLSLTGQTAVSFLNPSARTTNSSYNYTTDGVLHYNVDGEIKYWELYNSNSTPSIDLTEDSTTQVAMYSYSSEVQGTVFGTNFGNLGIITIYATFVLAIGRVIRGIFDRASERVIYEEMPEPTDLRELIEAISSARLEKKLTKEHQLYELLIRILRSPEVIMKITGGVQKYADGPEEQKGISTNDIPDNQEEGDGSLVVNNSPGLDKEEQEKGKLGESMMKSTRRVKTEEEESKDAALNKSLIKQMEQRLSVVRKKPRGLTKPGTGGIEMSEVPKESEEEEEKGRD